MVYESSLNQETSASSTLDSYSDLGREKLKLSQSLEQLFLKTFQAFGFTRKNQLYLECRLAMQNLASFLYHEAKVPQTNEHFIDSDNINLKEVIERDPWNYIIDQAEKTSSLSIQMERLVN